MAKLKTLSEAETARRRAITGLHNLGRDEDADRIEGLSAREYAQEKGIEIVENPRRRNRMPRQTKTRAELEADIDALQAENDDLQESVDDLQGQLDDISDILNPEDEGDDSDDGDDGENDQD
jgi:uncharacterized protein (DUF3084 family)